MSIEVIPLAASELDDAQDGILAVYRAAYAAPPYREDEEQFEEFAETLTRQRVYRGFRCCVAWDATGERLVGFGYGYAAGPGNWWREMIAEELAPGVAEKWLDDCFSFAELAVLPALQGRGLGGWLHDVLLESLEQRTAVLTTLQAETPALWLYRRRGWVTLKHDFVYPDGVDPYRVMGLDLRGREPRRAVGRS